MARSGFPRWACFLGVLAVGGIRGEPGIEAVSVPALELAEGTASTAILLAVEDSPAGEAALTEWSEYFGGASIEVPPVWVICFENTHIQEVAQDLPNVLSFLVEEGTSWKNVFHEFMTQVGTGVLDQTTDECKPRSQVCRR